MMKDIDALISRIRATPNCKVFEPCGLPTVAPYSLPVDLERFYRTCGGCVLFEQSDYSFRVVEPQFFQLANPVIINELGEDDISAAWFIVGRSGSQEYVTMDLDPVRRGRCYDSFWDRHGVAGSCPIIASSFTDLLRRMYVNRGEYWYWLRPDFQQMGDAYGEV